MHKEASIPHFKGKTAIDHVIEAQAEGMMSSTEIHGTEVPGHISSGADAARDSALILLLMGTLISTFTPPSREIFLTLIVFAFSWVIWKFGRSAWLAWSRLERLHRVLEQEKWEIEHHRQQERDELRELYAAKGFEGKLLEDVLDVLMADDNRLLRVMVQEELGLSLESHEHPLKQGVGAFVGSFITFLFCLTMWMLFPSYGLIAATLAVMGISGAVLAYYAGNRLLPATVWSIGLGALSYGTLHFLLQYVSKETFQ